MKYDANIKYNKLWSIYVKKKKNLQSGQESKG